MDKFLMRVWYKTDASATEPEHLGGFSETIPDTAFRDAEIVNVDWSQRGEVEVTFLINGRGHDS